MDRRCLVEACSREAEAHCFHCSRDVCTTHYLEHKQSIQEQIPLLGDEVNVIYDRLRRSNESQTATIPHHLIDVYAKLEQWRTDYHQQVETVYQRVRNQLQNIVNDYKREKTQKTDGILELIDEMREKWKNLLKEDNVTYRQVEIMKNQLQEIRKKERESINDPDIRIITKKIDVEKHINVIVERKHPIEKQSNLTATWYTPPQTVLEIQKPRTSRSPVQEARASRSLFRQSHAGRSTSRGWHTSRSSFRESRTWRSLSRESRTLRSSATDPIQRPSSGKSHIQSSSPKESSIRRSSAVEPIQRPSSGHSRIPPPPLPERCPSPFSSETIMCPLCNMKFPSYMNEETRNQHVNSHF